MKKLLISAFAVAPVMAFAGPGVYGDTPDAKHAWSVHDWNRPKPVKVQPADKPGNPPSDAVVLFDGTKASFEKNWCDKNGNPSQWKLGTEGDFYCVPDWKNGGDIYTKGKFGDCQFHIEYRHDADITDMGKGPQMRGNSGIFFMGPTTGHEIQVLESFYTSNDMAGKPGYVDNYTDGQAGSVYAENPPMVNPQRKPGEWQVYDIVFHQPVWDGLKLVHPGSVTVFFNGVLVQDHWELEGMTTHCKRKPLAPHETVAQMMLQDHGCTVHFRNVWYRPIPSRWNNKTHSVMSGDENEVMKLRRDTAAKLYAKIVNPQEVSVANLKALAEVIQYANEGAYKSSFDACLKACRDKKFDDKAKSDANRALMVLIRNKVIPENSKL